MLRDGLAARSELDEVRHSPEWRPEMPQWPSSRGEEQLGGCDLALRFRSEETYSTVIEPKWSRHGLIDALDEVMWDAFKLAHATATLPGVSNGLLIYLACGRAWAKPARHMPAPEGGPLLRGDDHASPDRAPTCC